MLRVLTIKIKPHTAAFTFKAQQLTSNQKLKRTLDCNLLSLPLQSAALKRRLSRR